MWSLNDFILKVRSLAANSQRMREELRRKYGKDSFDKVALETELQAKIGCGHTSATKNKSTVLLAWGKLKPISLLIAFANGRSTKAVVSCQYKI